MNQQTKEVTFQHYNVLYSVWVDGIEVNDNLLTLESAKNLAEDYIDDDYDDVSVEGITEDEYQAFIDRNW